MPLLTMAMMLPRRFSIIGWAKRRETRSGPMTLTSRAFRQSSGVVSRVVRRPVGGNRNILSSAAVLMSTSVVPNFAMVWSKTSSTWASLVTSMSRTRARSLPASSARKSSTPAQDLSVATARAPAASAPRTNARPMPLAPPVTTTTRPSSCGAGGCIGVLPCVPDVAARPPPGSSGASIPKCAGSLRELGGELLGAAARGQQLLVLVRDVLGQAVGLEDLAGVAGGHVEPAAVDLDGLRDALLRLPGHEPVDEYLGGVGMGPAADDLDAAGALGELARRAEALDVHREAFQLERAHLVHAEPDADGVAVADHPLGLLAVVAGDDQVLSGEELTHVVLAKRHELRGERAEAGAAARVLDDDAALPARVDELL